MSVRIKNENDEAIQLYLEIQNNNRLKQMEVAGFKRGAKKGKSMNVKFPTLITSLRKQMQDFMTIYVNNLMEPKPDAKDRMLHALADIRNVAGCCFLKIEEKVNET